MEGNAITSYASLSGKIHTLVIDKTLSISGAAADAKAVSDAIGKAIIEGVSSVVKDFVAIDADEISNICK